MLLRRYDIQPHLPPPPHPPTKILYQGSDPKHPHTFPNCSLCHIEPILKISFDRGDKMALGLSYIYNGNSYTCEMDC